MRERLSCNTRFAAVLASIRVWFGLTNGHFGGNESSHVNVSQYACSGSHCLHRHLHRRLPHLDQLDAVASVSRIVSAD